MNNLNDLKVYVKAENLSDELWNEVYAWKDYFIKDTIGKQLVRSADSIGANIAEGFGRFHYKENKNFCYFSRGSLVETKGWVNKCLRRNLINQLKAETYLNELYQIHKMLNSYIKYIGKNPNSTEL